MKIFKNAIDSIVLGIEDYNSADPRRPISAMRNLVAGVLLLIKHKLSTLSEPGSDEALIKQRVLPEGDGAGGIKWVGEGNKTVDVQQMKERCTSLGITVDWSRVEKIVRHRNEIEHYFSSVPQGALRALVAESFVVIRDFLRDELDEDPLTSLGTLTWTTLTKVAEVYQKEKTECAANLDTVDWAFDELSNAFKEWECPKCGSGLIDVENTGTDKWSAQLKCRACGETFDFEIAAESAVKSFFWADNHVSVQDGGEGVTIECPHCSRDTYHLGENVCLVCEETAERQCKVCENSIPASEIDGTGVCGYCRHMMDKDD